MFLKGLSYWFLYMTWDIFIWYSSPPAALELFIAVYSYLYQFSIRRSMEHSYLHDILLLQFAWHLTYEKSPNIIYFIMRTLLLKHFIMMNFDWFMWASTEQLVCIIHDTHCQVTTTSLMKAEQFHRTTHKYVHLYVLSNGIDRICVIHFLNLMCMCFLCLYSYLCLYSTEKWWLYPCLNSASGSSLLTEYMQKCL